MKWDSKKNLLHNKKAFTLVEMSVALIILGIIIATVFTVINNAMDTVGNWQTKIDAFEIARENMEKLLAQKSLSDTVEYGTSEKNPDISWQTKVESFYEPVSKNMWMRAVCTSEFMDSTGETQKIELEHWLTSLSKKQIMQILEQQAREEKYAESVSGDSQDETQTDDEQTSDEQTSDDSQTSSDSDLESTLGTPPEGYSSWNDVPAEQLFEALKNSSK